MDPTIRLEIINREGWRREHPLQKKIVYLGSDPNTDVFLDPQQGGGVNPLHAQLIALSGPQPVYRLINLAEQNLNAGTQMLPPNAALTLSDGQQFIVGEYTLVFRCSEQLPPLVAAAAVQSDFPAVSSRQRIGLKVALPSNQLIPHQSLEGVVMVSNLGEYNGVRFDLKLEGFEAGCYDLAPGPVLSQGAEKAVLLRLHHHGHTPLAGDWRLVIRAAAPTAYPGEWATATQIVQVLPLYQHRLTLVPTAGIKTLLFLPEKAAPMPSPVAPPLGQPVFQPAPSPSFAQPVFQPAASQPVFQSAASPLSQPMARPLTTPEPAAWASAAPTAPVANWPKPQTPLVETTWSDAGLPTPVEESQRPKPVKTIKAKADAAAPKKRPSENEEWWSA